jgi:uncharacterized membrane protein
LLAYLAGAVLLILSLLLKKKYKLFSSILFSGAMATFYFTTYAAYTYYGLYSFGLTFALMVIVTIILFWGANLFNRQEIGLLGMVGAYGIPFLISKNSENAELLFAYVAFINIGVSLTSIKKQWKEMSQLAVVVTWTLIIGWLVMRYAPESRIFAIVIIGFFYTLFLITSLYLRVDSSNKLARSAYWIITLNNLAAFASALILFSFYPPDIAIWFISLIATLLFVGFSIVFQKMFPNEFLHRIFFLLALALFCVSAIFYWNGIISTLICALLGSVLFITGLIRNQLWLRYAATIVMGFSLAKLLLYDLKKFTTVEKVVAFIVIGVLLLIISFFYQKKKYKLIGEV